MEIKGKVHLLFEQSATFRDAFRELGYEAYCYDIQNNFGKTDYQIDLFAEIEKSYEGGVSLFDKITTEDLVMAFFPCIYFETIQQLVFALAKHDQKNWPMCDKIEYAIKRLDSRTEFHKLLYKLLWVAYKKSIRLIIENPATEPNYLITGQNFPTPTFIDKDRTLRGDIFKKPTGWWFVNCEPTHGLTVQKDKETKRIDRSKPSAVAGLCSEERSMIHPDYARNFVCDFIIGKEQTNSQLSLF